METPMTTSDPFPPFAPLREVEARSSVARSAQLAAGRLGLAFAFLDDEGYVFSVGDGERRVVLGSGACTPYAVNSASAYTLCRDKAYTNLVLARAGLRVIPSRLFFLHDDHRASRAPGRERTDLEAFAESAPYPVFAKPNTGSRGDLAEPIDTPRALLDWADRAAARYESVLVQPVMRGREYRVFVLDGWVLFSYRRQPGDHGAANLARGGRIEDFVDGAPEPLAAVALAAAAALDLKLAGVDLFDLAEPGASPELAVIEVNANPDLASLEAAGRDDLAMILWSAVFRAALRP